MTLQVRTGAPLVSPREAVPTGCNFPPVRWVFAPDLRSSGYRLHGADIPDFPVDLGPQLAEEGDGSFEVALGQFVCSTSWGVHG
jgi:hypothetical protein